MTNRTEVLRKAEDPLSFTSLITLKYSGFSDLFFLAAWKGSLMLVGIVSSRILTDVFYPGNVGYVREMLMLVGIVAAGESGALHVVISAYTLADLGF